MPDHSAHPGAPPTAGTPVHPPAALPRGTRLGEFELRHVLGVGGFAIVYLAFDHQLEREVAVKEYMPTMLAGRTETLHVSLRSQSDAETFALGLKSFVNEARLLARFDLPSLVRVHRFWEENGTAYMAMAVVRGQSAKAWRQAQSQPPDEAWLRALLAPMLDTLDTLHAEAVYHRDIAPDNIQIDEAGRPVLLDLGAARRVIGDATQTLTAILKPAYAPIEQYAEVGALRQGAWTDLYALGATLHYLLLGRPPMPATARALHDELPPLAGQALPGVSLRFAQIVDWMLSPRPQDRPQSVDMLREALQGRVSPPERVHVLPAAAVQWERTQRVAGARAASPPDSTAGQGGATGPASSAAALPVSALSLSNDGDAAATVLRSVRVPAGTVSERLPDPAAATVPPLPTSTPPPAPAQPPDQGLPPQAAASAPKRSKRAPVLAGLAGLVVMVAAAGAWLASNGGASSAASDQTATLAPAVAAAALPVLPAPAPEGKSPGSAATASVGASPGPTGSPVGGGVLPEGQTAPPLSMQAKTQTELRTPSGPESAPERQTETQAALPAAPTRSAPTPAAGTAVAGRAAAAQPPVRRAAPQQRPAAEPAVASVDPTLARPSLASEPLPRPLAEAPPPPVAPVAAAPAPTPATLLGPTERCGRRVLLALWNCIDRECRDPALRSHPECVKLREDRERNARGRF